MACTAPHIIFIKLYRVHFLYAKNIISFFVCFVMCGFFILRNHTEHVAMKFSITPITSSSVTQPITLVKYNFFGFLSLLFLFSDEIAMPAM